MKMFWGSWKSFRGDFTKKPIYRGGLLKKGGLEQIADLRGAWQKRGGCF